MRKIAAALVAWVWLCALAHAQLMTTGVGQGDAGPAGGGGGGSIVTFDAKVSSDCYVSGTTNTCNNMTVGSGLTNSVLVVTASWNSNGTPTSFTATWNGVSMTLVGSTYSGATSSGSAIWCLAAPASGNHPIVVTLSGATSMGDNFVGATSYQKVNQTTPCANYTSAVNSSTATASLTVTTANGDAAVAAWDKDTGSFTTFSGTLIFADQTHGTTIDAASNYDFASGSSTVLTASVGSVITWVGNAADIQHQ